MRNRSRVTATILAVMAALGIALTVTAGSANAATPDRRVLSLAAQCYTDNVTPVDQGGLPWDMKWFLDVRGTSKADGYFIYYDPGTRSYGTIRWAPNSALPGGGTRFGVSTLWGYQHPWWKVTFWRYVYSC